MIYKFIDGNGSEITVNSLSSLQALVDSETVKKNTKVKAGLRGKWVTAESISDLVFEEKKDEQMPEEIVEPEKDIKSIITESENSTPQEEIKEDSKTKGQDSQTSAVSICTLGKRQLLLDSWAKFFNQRTTFIN